MSSRSIKGAVLNGLLLSGLIACASAPSQNTTSQSLQSRFAMVMADSEAPDPGRLEAFAIPPGRCGMILYSRSGIQAVPVFRSTDDGTALMKLEGALTALSLVGRGGETRRSVPSAQHFRGKLETGMGVTVSAVTSWGQTFPGGAYVDNGTLTVRAADGWTRVIPVAGIAGCKAE